jgi:hypothetical protein
MDHAHVYGRPSVTDYGSLRDLTASNGANENEDGIGKIIHTDGSDPIG